MTVMKYCLSAAAGALALGLATVSTQAAPAGSTTGLKASAGTETSVDQVSYRRCWWHNGHRHCRRYGGYGDGYYPYYGYGPSFGLYFGGGHRHHRHHHHRRHW